MKGALIVLALFVVASAVGLILYKSNTRTIPRGGVENQLPALNTDNATISEEVLIKQAFAEENNYSVDEVFLRVDNIEGSFARGVAGLQDEEDAGWWFAEEVDGEWDVVVFGYGPVICDEVGGYGFPESILTDCFSEEEPMNEELEVYL